MCKRRQLFHTCVMDIRISSVIPLVTVTVLLCLRQVTSQNIQSACTTRCTNMISYLSRYSFSQSYLTNSYSSCYNKCVNPNNNGLVQISWNRQTTPPPVITPRQPITQPPVVWTPRPTQPRVVWTPGPTQPPVVWTPKQTQPPAVWTPRPPVVWTPRPTQPPYVWTPRSTQPPAVWTPRPTAPPVTFLPPVRTAPPVTRGPIPIFPTAAPVPVRPSQLGCGYMRKFTSRIIGGQTAAACEFPWMVSIRVPGDVCGGAILDRRHVLTAAHCLKDLYYDTVIPAKNVKVKVGSSSLAQLRVVGVQKLYVHPKHNFFRDYDVAVITLDEDLSFGSCIAPVCLPTAQQAAATMSECVVTGWGILDPTGNDRRQPNELQKVTVPIVKTENCKAAYGGQYFNDLKLCAGYYYQGMKDSCKGDSGGPLVCRNKNGPYSVFGVVSFGNGCARPRYPGVYTKVNNPSVMKYILESVNQPYV